jgi:outer membrane lipoprotein SlyB
MEKLNQLMSGELIVGPDATNATELLYDIVGDDELFDILNDLADRSEGRANIWDDSDVQRRLAELGVQTPQSTAAEPADVPQDTAPEVKEDQLDEIDIDTLNQLASHPMAGTMAAAGGAAIGGVIGKGIEKAADWYKGKKEQQALARHKQQGVAEGDNMSTFVEDRELAEMLKYAGVPIKEGVLKDDTRNTWDHLLDRFRHEVEQFRQGSDLDSDLYDALFDYYDQHGAMPYRVRNAKDGTANQWISSRLADDLGIDEGVLGTVGGAALGGMLGGPVGAAVGSTAGQEMTKGGSGLIEGSCNMTAEGSYCPEHGLMECGSMEEDGGAVGMPYSMGEAQAPQDPINSNSAMTGSYYEGKETDIQEGDALLARIKSLALLR